MGKWLTEPTVERLIEHHGRSLVAGAARLAIDEARQSVLSGAPLPSPEALLERLEAALVALSTPSLIRVINGTGVVLHTNLGRAPLSPSARAAVLAAAEGYSNLELDLSTGRRGKREVHVGPLAAELCGAEAGLAVNNCAGATLLMLAACAERREVIVSRGELVEIGGGFRVPEIMEVSGARLVEVGTTNKVYPEDYRRAVTASTAAILVVHRSNFAVVGFEHTPAPEEMAEVAEGAGVPLLVDLGSGLLADDADLGRAAAAVGQEPRPKRWVAAGADLVAFSGDKLLGGPQAGILVGRASLVARCAKHPLARALRLDKLGIAALEATLLQYRAGRASEIPCVRALAEPIERVAGRAEALRRALLPWFEGDEAPRVVPSAAKPGGGALPLVELPSRAVLVGPAGGAAEQLAARLRAGRPAILGRILEGRLALDARTIDDDEIPLVARGIRDAKTNRAADATTGAER